MDSNDKKPSLILPLVLIGGAVAIAYASTLKKVVDAASTMRYQLTRIQIYRLKLTEPIIFRVWVEFTNLEKIELIIQQIYIDLFLNFGSAEEPNLTRIATLNPNDYVIIPAYSTQELAFDIQVRWVNLAVNAYQMFKGLLDGSGVKFPNTAVVDGVVKTENISIPIEKEIPFNTTPIEQ